MILIVSKKIFNPDGKIFFEFFQNLTRVIFASKSVK